MTTVHLLHAGYANARVGSSVVLVRDGDALIVTDPGVKAAGLLQQALSALPGLPVAVFDPQNLTAALTAIKPGDPLSTDTTFSVGKRSRMPE